MNQHLEQLTDKVIVTRWSDGKGEQAEDVVACEARVSLWLNGELVVNLMCLPAELDALAVGFLVSEGILAGLKDLDSIRVDERSGRIECRGHVDDEALAARRENRTLDAGCGGGDSCVGLIELAECWRIDTAVRFDVAALLSAAMRFNSGSPLHAATGCVHTAALCDSSGTEILRSDDVGRHNAFDKVMGLALLRGVDVCDKVTLTTARISADTTSKAIRHRVPVIGSRAAPTSRALWLAQRYGITVIGFLRGSRMNVYTRPERITGLEASPDPTRGVSHDLLHRVRQAALDGGLSCESARILTRETGASLAEVGAACRVAGISIRQCELGCF